MDFRVRGSFTGVPYKCSSIGVWGLGFSKGVHSHR